MKLSVVMTAFNAERTIELALQSVLSNTYRELEVIVVDDGSDDGTADAVANCHDARIRLVRVSRMGRSRACNYAAAIAMGEYLAIADADDESLPHRFAQQVEFLDRRPTVDVLGCQLIAVREQQAWHLKYPISHADIVGELSEGRMPIAHAGVMFRRSWFVSAGGFNEDFERAEDFEIYYRNRTSTVFAALPTDVVRYNFRILSFGRWRRDESFVRRAQRIGRRGFVVELFGYLKYQIVVRLQMAGIRLGARGGRRS